MTSTDPKHRLHYLTGVSTTEAKTARRDGLGLLIQPGNSTHRDAERYNAGVGADNGFYGLGAKHTPTAAEEAAAVDRWRGWLTDVVAPIADRVLFATVPDVLNWLTLDDGKRIPVGDAEATLLRYFEHYRTVRDLGLPAALVLQDGLELDGAYLKAGRTRLAWALVDVVFVGGSDDFKLGAEAEAICREARRRGKWVHVGRVNSWRRIERVRDYADSVDGTFLGFGPRANWPRLEGWLDRLEAELFPTPTPALALAA